MVGVLARVVRQPIARMKRMARIARIAEIERRISPLANTASWRPKNGGSV
jgi:hypothetical protein